MEPISTQSWALLAVGLVIGLLALAAWFVSLKKQPVGLQQRFGPEYARTVETLGSTSKAEAELKARQARVERLTIVALSAPEIARFSQTWTALQGRFVDNPKGVLGQADQLVRELMQKRGYPIADFAHRAADISVDHPAVVEHYRAAQAITLRDQRGEADTEDLRKGGAHFRALFEELLDTNASQSVVSQPAALHA